MPGPHGPPRPERRGPRHGGESDEDVQGPRSPFGDGPPRPLDFPRHRGGPLIDDESAEEMLGPRERGPHSHLSGMRFHGQHGGPWDGEGEGTPQGLPDNRYSQSFHTGIMRGKMGDGDVHEPRGHGSHTPPLGRPLYGHGGGRLSSEVNKSMRRLLGRHRFNRHNACGIEREIRRCWRRPPDAPAGCEDAVRC